MGGVDDFSFIADYIDSSSEDLYRIQIHNSDRDLVYLVVGPVVAGDINISGDL
jgi:hypothetical protein